ATLAQLSSAALRIDSRQFERLLERKLELTASQSPRGPRHPSTSSFPQPQRFINSVPASPVPRPPPAPTPASDGSTPMELDFSQSYPSRFRAPLGNERNSVAGRSTCVSIVRLTNTVSRLAPSLLRSKTHLRSDSRWSKRLTPTSCQKTALRSNPGGPPERFRPPSPPIPGSRIHRHSLSRLPALF